MKVSFIIARRNALIGVKKDVRLQMPNSLLPGPAVSQDRSIFTHLDTTSVAGPRMTSLVAWARPEGSRFISTVTAPLSQVNFMNFEAGLTWTDLPVTAMRSASRIVKRDAFAAFAGFLQEPSGASFYWPSIADGVDVDLDVFC